MPALMFEVAHLRRLLLEGVKESAQTDAVGDLQPYATVRGLALLALAGRERRDSFFDRNADWVEVASELRHPPCAEVGFVVVYRRQPRARTRTRGLATRGFIYKPRLTTIR